MINILDVAPNIDQSKSFFAKRLIKQNSFFTETLFFRWETDFFVVWASSSWKHWLRLLFFHWVSSWWEFGNDRFCLRMGFFDVRREAWQVQDCDTTRWDSSSMDFGISWTFHFGLFFDPNSSSSFSFKRNTESPRFIALGPLLACFTPTLRRLVARQ